MSREPKQLEHLTQRELATVLAALRYWQNDMNADMEEREEDWVSICDGAGHFTEYKPLTNKEIDALCERINR